MLKTVGEIPATWTWAMLALGLASCLSITHPADGGWEVSFAVTTTTVGIFALIWLPALIRLLALTGGRIKAAGVEATTGGLIGSSEDLIQGLTGARTAAEQAQLNMPEVHETLEKVTAKIDQIAEQFVVAGEAIPDAAVARLARRYEELRASLPPGDERTVAMTEIVNEARVRASADRERARNLGVLLIRSRSDGQRIVGLAFLQEAPSVDAFDDVLGLVTSSATAFEMFHALAALRSLIPELSPDRRRQAVEALRTEEADPRGVGVMDDSNLPRLIDLVIEELEATH
jgi:hypothetical protein